MELPRRPKRDNKSSSKRNRVKQSCILVVRGVKDNFCDVRHKRKGRSIPILSAVVGGRHWFHGMEAAMASLVTQTQPIVQRTSTQDAQA